MTLFSAHSRPNRKLVTLTEEIRVCKRAPNKSSPLTRTSVFEVRLDESWSRRRDLNPRPTDYKSVALPTELRRPDCEDEGETRSGNHRFRQRDGYYQQRLSKVKSASNKCAQATTAPRLTLY